tara:strand:+ start:2837 stop:3325 length:489 start_codon:yes stop_codon:yes gene_type:complete
MKKIIILLMMPLLFIGCGDGDGDGDGNNNNNDTTFDSNEPMIGSWQQISEVRYLFEEGIGYGRACLGELDPELPSKIFAYSNGKLDMYFYECTGGDEFNPVQSEELLSLGGNWEQIGSQGNYLFFDPADEEPNEEIVYFEFSSDKSQFTHDTGEVIQIWERQ